jgi:Ca-activated chloride channel family protein
MLFSRAAAADDEDFAKVRAIAPLGGRAAPKAKGGAVDTSPAGAFSRQGAGGLWGDESSAEAACAETVRVLERLFAEGIDARHSVYGAQVKKAVDALLAAAPRLLDEDLRARLLVLAWLLSGRRTRALVVKEAGTSSVAAHLASEDAARAFLAASPA